MIVLYIRKKGHLFKMEKHLETLIFTGFIVLFMNDSWVSFKNISFNRKNAKKKMFKTFLNEIIDSDG